MRVEKHLLFWLTALAALIGSIALLREIIFPFVAAAVIAYFLSPIADRLERIGLNRAVSAIAILSVGTLLVALALVLLVPALIDQARQLVAAMPGEMQRLRQVLEELAGAWLGPNTPAGARGVRPGDERGVQELDQLRGHRPGLDLEPGAGAGEPPRPAADHPRRRLLSAAGLEPDAGAHRRGAAARLRPHHPPPGRRDQRRGVGLHSRPGRHLPDARHVLCAGLDLGRHQLRAADRPHHGPAGLHPHRRLGAGPRCAPAAWRSCSSGPTRPRWPRSSA